MRFVLFFDLLTILFFTLIWISIVMFLYFKKKKNLVYLICFTLFYMYLFKVLDYTLFQFQSLLLLKFFLPNLILNGQTAEKSMNFIPLITLTPKDLETSLLNILLFIPFGFGLPFITKLNLNKIITIGALLSLIIELLQLVTGLLAKITFRIADINDLIFNTIGTAIGFLLFLGFIKIYHHIFQKSKKSKNPFLQYVDELQQIDKQSK